MENFQILIIVFMACLQTTVMSHFIQVGEAQCWCLILKLTWILEKALMVSVILGQKIKWVWNFKKLGTKCISSENGCWTFSELVQPGASLSVPSSSYLTPRHVRCYHFFLMNLYIKNLHNLESLRIVGYTDILKEAVFCIWPYLLFSKSFVIAWGTNYFGNFSSNVERWAKCIGPSFGLLWIKFVMKYQ